MNKKRFHFKEALVFAIKMVRQFPLQILLPVFIYIIFMVPALYFDLKLFSRFLVNQDYVAVFTGILILYAVLFIFIVFQFVILSGFVKIATQWIETKTKPILRECYKIDFELFGKYLGVSLIYGLLIEIGLILLVVPGIVMMVLYNLCIIILIDKHGGMRRSFGISDKLVSGVMWQFLGFMTLTGLIISGPSAYYFINYFMLQKINLMLLVILFGIITFLLNALIQLSYIYLYKDLSAQQDEIDLCKINN
jgi:hypothetical protein